MPSPRKSPMLVTACRFLLGALFAAPALMASDGAPPALFAAGVSGPAGNAAAAPIADEARIEYEELLLEARVNGLPPAVILLALRGPDQRLWLAEDNFVFWDMHPPATAALHHLGRNYQALDGQPGLSYLLDSSRLTLEISAGPEWFTENRVDSGVNAAGRVPMVSPGAFLNYDINMTYSDSDSNVAGLFDAGLFNSWGVAASTFLVRNAQSNQNGGLIRLDTTWTRDLPEQRTSLRVGDAIGGSGAWGRAVRFGGVQWATNFATQPGLITFPLPTLEGEAALPSTLELYVNGIRRMQSEVPTGPFSVTDLPTVTGQGEVQLVVRDLLGREMLIRDTFYVSSRLLREGLHEFSYEVGAERESYGQESNDYGRTFAAGTHRYGFNENFTGELRAELSSGQYTAGVGGSLLLERLGLLHAALAGSHGDRGAGGQFMVGFEHSSRHVGFGVNLQAATSDFAQLGYTDDRQPPKRLGQAWLSVPLKRAGSISLSYLRRDEQDELRFETITASYQVSLGRIGYLSAFATRLRAEEEDTLLGVSYTRLMGARTSSSVSGNFSQAGDQLLMQLQRSLPVGSGYGYRVRNGMLDQERFDAGISAQNDYGTLDLDVSHSDGENGVRVSGRGGMAWLDDSFHIGRQMDQSFGVVRVGDFEGVKIYADNQHVATTDERGRALLPRLRPYEENPLRIDVGDLPLDAQVNQVELQAVPYFRSGLVVDFAVSRSRNAIFRLLRVGGEPVPVGSVIFTPGGEQFPVGYDGETFVTGVDSGASLRATWNGTRCVFELILPDNDDPLPDLGTITCEEAVK